MFPYVSLCFYSMFLCVPMFPEEEQKGQANSAVFSYAMSKKMI